MMETVSTSEARPDERERFLADVVRGLSAPRKWTPPKWFYDQRGCELYERITRLEAYYLTRTEAAILEAHAADVARILGPEALVFEYGAGSATKTLLLLAALERPEAYLPVEMSRPALLAARETIQGRFPALPVRPVLADFTEPFELPADDLPAARRVGFFPGSTIGNFEPREAAEILRRIAQQAGPGGGLVIGVDVAKDEATLERAYDDPEGVTAAFDLNLLARANRELGADFRLDAFRHRALWDARRSRVEMHLESLVPQSVRVDGRVFTFREGETIHTESSYKWESRAFDALAAVAGWRLERTFTDERGWFAVKVLSVA